MPTEAELQHELAVQTANDIENGNRSDARRRIREHYDPAWFVVEVLVELREMNGRPGGVNLADMRRLLRV